MGIITFYANDESVVIVDRYTSPDWYFIFFFNTCDVTEKKQGLYVEFASEEELDDWLVKNHYIRIPMYKASVSDIHFQSND